MAVTKKKCLMCGKMYHGTAKAVYCGNTCRQAAFREKKRVEKRELAMAKMTAKLDE